MAPLGLEKRAVASVGEDGPGLPQSTSEKPARRRVLPLIATLAAALFLFTTWAASGRCAAGPQPAVRHGGLQALHHTPPKLPSQEVVSRSPLVEVDDIVTETTSAAAPARTVLKTFEVDPPVLLPDGPAESDGPSRPGNEPCTVLLMRHDFAWSYNAPFVGMIGCLSLWVLLGAPLCFCVVSDSVLFCHQATTHPLPATSTGLSSTSAL